LVENGGFGGSTAAPIAQKVIDAYLLAPEGPEANKPAATTITGSDTPATATPAADASTVAMPGGAPHSAT
jgi:penicillin-binding protein 2